MYNETGLKIKKFAETMSWIGIVLCFLIAIVPILMLSSGSQPGNDPAPEWFIWVVVAGILFGIVGAFLCWLRYLLLAGFGELIEENAKSAAELKEIKELLREKM